MSLKSGCLLCIAQARTRSLWFCREQAPTNAPISEAALGMVPTLGDFPANDFPFPCNSVSSKPHAKILYKFSAETRAHLAWVSPGWTGAGWREKRHCRKQTVSCGRKGDTGLFIAALFAIRWVCGYRGFYNSFWSGMEAMQISAAYLRDGWGLRKWLLNKPLLHWHEDCLLL